MFWLSLVFGIVGLIMLLGIKVTVVKIIGMVLILVGVITSIVSVYGGGTPESMMSKVQQVLPIRVAEEINDSKIKDGSIVVYVAGVLAGDASGEAGDPAKAEYNESFGNIISTKTGRSVAIVPVEWTHGETDGSIVAAKNNSGEPISFDTTLIPGDAKIFVFLSPKLGFFAEDIVTTQVWKTRIAGGKGAAILIGQDFPRWKEQDKDMVEKNMICSIDLRPDAYKFILEDSMGMDDIFEKQFMVEDGEMD